MERVIIFCVVFHLSSSVMNILDDESNPFIINVMTMRHLSERFSSFICACVCALSTKIIVSIVQLLVITTI